ncbi:MAG: hypothetical protein KJ072_21105 [Verrucomicrobia bacterium]|nr:hypothetical protein [Verrucomicrobiota bacterium]
MKKWKVTLSIKGQLRETIVYAADQNSALAIARAQYVGAEVRYVVEAK